MLTKKHGSLLWNGGCGMVGVGGVEQLALNESACSDSLLPIYANSDEFGPKFVLLQQINYIGSRSEHRNESAEIPLHPNLSPLPLPLNQVSPLQSWGTRPGIRSPSISVL